MFLTRGISDSDQRTIVTTGESGKSGQLDYGPQERRTSTSRSQGQRITAFAANPLGLAEDHRLTTPESRNRVTLRNWSWSVEWLASRIIDWQDFV